MFASCTGERAGAERVQRTLAPPAIVLGDAFLSLTSTSPYGPNLRSASFVLNHKNAPLGGGH